MVDNIFKRMLVILSFVTSIFFVISLILVDFSSFENWSSDEKKSVDTEISPRQVEFLQETKHASAQKSRDTLYSSVIIITSISVFMYQIQHSLLIDNISRVSHNYHLQIFPLRKV